jgi:isocitrate/isopropylmalate dehydrogenase
VLQRSDGFFQEVVEGVVKEYPGLAYEHFFVDDASRRLVRFPQAMDVVLCMNLYGDILSDLAAEAAGGNTAMKLNEIEASPLFKGRRNCGKLI